MTSVAVAFALISTLKFSEDPESDQNYKQKNVLNSSRHFSKVLFLVFFVCLLVCLLATWLVCTVKADLVL